MTCSRDTCARLPTDPTWLGSTAHASKPLELPALSQFGTRQIYHLVEFQDLLGLDI
jgi:hypothetical protein